MINCKLSHILILHFQDGHGEEEELSVHVSPLLVIFFVFCMCSMLVLLYFFFNQLVYVIMFMFCTASTMAMYMCLEPLVMMTYKLPCFPVVTLPRMNLYLCILQLELRWHIKTSYPDPA